MTRNPSMTSIPTTLPPPYTSTGTRQGALWTNASDFPLTAEILVGSKRKRFLIHTALLTSQSPYFRAALTGPFLESTYQSIVLEDIEVSIFELCVTWLYTGDIYPVPFKDGRPAYYTMLHLYILADRVCLEGLRNRVIDLMADLADSTNSVLTPSDTRILYEGIRDEAPIRQLVLDLFAFKKTDKLLAAHPDRWHALFLRDLTVRLKKPCEQAMMRHRLRMWCPESWHVTRACENCRGILTPWYGAVGCDECCLAWCLRCVGDGVAMAGWEDGRVRCEVDPGGEGTTTTAGAAGKDTRSGLGAKSSPGRKWESCKPWRGSRCAIYHEHDETERCGEVFLGR